LSLSSTNTEPIDNDVFDTIPVITSLQQSCASHLPLGFELGVTVGVRVGSGVGVGFMVFVGVMVGVIAGVAVLVGVGVTTTQGVQTVPKLVIPKYGKFKLKQSKVVVSSVVPVINIPSQHS
jgi:hypothetical protein